MLKLQARTLWAALRSRISQEHGLTLMETLVAMIAGLAVTGALFGILEVSLHQTSRIEDKVQADQLGRITMTKIVDELHSACISPEFRPIREKSSGTELRFVDAVGKEAVLKNGVLHKIVWAEESSKLKTGTLTDYSYQSTGGEWPTFTFNESTPTSTVQIATNISKYEGNAATPIFQYFPYATASSGETSSTQPLSTISTTALTGNSKGELSSTEAETAASVLISFNAAPVDGYEALHRDMPVSNQVVFAFSAPPSETPIEAAPCQ